MGGVPTREDRAKSHARGILNGRRPQIMEALKEIDKAVMDMQRELTTTVPVNQITDLIMTEIEECMAVVASRRTKNRIKVVVPFVDFIIKVWRREMKVVDGEVVVVEVKNDKHKRRKDSIWTTEDKLTLVRYSLQGISNIEMAEKYVTSKTKDQINGKKKQMKNTGEWDDFVNAISGPCDNP